MQHKFLTAAIAAFFAFGTCVASANEAIQTQPVAAGQLVYPVDMNQWPETSRNEAGGAITALMGVQNLLPASNPLSATLSNSTMTFTIGGGGQTIIAQDSTSGGSGNTRYIDSCPTQTITIPANSTGSTRTDLLSIEYNQLATNPHSVPFSNNTTQTVSNALESCLYSYNTATSTPPTNYVAFASVAVPNGATTASQATVTYLFPTVSARITSVLGGFVSSVNGNQGALTAAAGNGLIVSTQSNGFTYTLSTPVSLSNGGNNTSTPSLTAGTNLSSSGSWANQTLNVIANPTFSGAVTANSGIVLPVAGVIGNNQAVNNQLVIGTPSQNTFLREYRTSGGQTEMATGSCANSGIWCLNNYGGLGSLLTVDASGDQFVLGNSTVGGTLTGSYLQLSNTDVSPNITTLYGDGSHTVASINANVFGVLAQSGVQALAVNASGDLGVARNLSIGGGATIPGASSFGAGVGITGNTTIGGTLGTTGATTGSSASYSGSVTSPSISKIYFNGSQITSPLIESVSGTTVVGTTTVSLSAPWTVAPQCTGTVSNGTAAHSIAIGATTTTAVQVADGAVDTFNLTCVGH